jgi:hypothetical protein
MEVPLAGRVDRRPKKVALGDKFVSLTKIYNRPIQVQTGSYPMPQLLTEDQRYTKYTGSQP